MEAPWLLPTQKVTGVVELSTNTLRMFVDRGRGYSVNWPLLGSSRVMRSVNIDPVHASPFLSTTTSYGALHGVGSIHSWICSVLGSNIPIAFPLYSANQRRFCESTLPRRGRELAIGVRYTVSFFVFASSFPMFPAEKSSR